MEQNNDPETLIATDLSKLAIAFKNETKSRKRDALFLQICEKYMPKVRGDLKHIPKHNHEEFIQIYRIEVYKALVNWKMKSNFDTYLYSYIQSVYRRYLDGVKMFKMVKVKNDDGTVTKRSIEYTLFCDMDENEEPSKEIYDNIYDNDGE
jgi:hypothetical protein